MKRKFNFILLSLLLLFIVCGCSKDDSNSDVVTVNEDVNFEELKEMIESNTKLIEELTTKNQELEEKISSLEEEKNTLIETVSSLQEKNTKVSESLDSKYNELKTLINNKTTNNTSNNYTITKSQLLGTWKYGTNSSITFTDDNLNVYGNWFTWKDMAMHYMYKDGILYMSDDGVIMTK